MFPFKPNGYRYTLPPIGGALFVSTALLIVVFGQMRLLSGTVRTLKDDPVGYAKVSIVGGPSTATLDSGVFTFPLQPPLKIGYPATFLVDGWIIFSPCMLERGRLYVPDPDAEPILLQVVKKGDKHFLSQSSIGCILEVKFSHFVKPPLPVQDLKVGIGNLRGQELHDAGFLASGPSGRFVSSLSSTPIRVGTLRSEEDRNVVSLDKEANDLGLNPADLSKAIFSEAEKTDDPYLQGLYALYSRRYVEASTFFTKSIEASEKKTIKQYVMLARAELEQDKFDTAITWMRAALEKHPDDPLLLENLGEIYRLKDAKDRK